ncbi:MAG: Cdc6/Cdc18 family protein [Promethearchaeota archaeon]
MNNINNEKNSFNIDEFFDDYLKTPNFFKNRAALDSAFIPKELPHRNDQIKAIAQITACALKDANPSNIFIYGKCGTGKTAVVKYVGQKINQKSKEVFGKQPFWIYINCNNISTTYRIIANIHNKLDPKNPLPPTGVPLDIIINKVLNLLDDVVKDSICFIVLDEIDRIKDKSSRDNILYILSRINEELHSARVNIIGISNVLNFKDDLDPRAASSLCEEEILFPVYTAPELKEILASRSKVAFKDGVISEETLSLCAAIAAGENGDARRALSILRKAAEIAERRGLDKITQQHIYLARDKLDKDKVKDFIRNLPAQQKALVLAIYLLVKYTSSRPNKGLIYSAYSELIQIGMGLKPLTTRRISDLIKELELSGIISSEVKSFGRARGRTRIVDLEISEKQIRDAFENDLYWSNYLNYKPSFLKRANINIYGGVKYKSLF